MLKRIGIFAGQLAVWLGAVFVLMVLPFIWAPSVLLWLVPLLFWPWTRTRR